MENVQIKNRPMYRGGLIICEAVFHLLICKLANFPIGFTPHSQDEYRSVAFLMILPGGHLVLQASTFHFS